MGQKRFTWAYEGPVNLNNKRHSIDFRCYTIAASEEEARRNIIWQYKIRFGLLKNSNVGLDGIIYKVLRPINIATPKEKIKYDYDQLSMDI